MPKKLDIPESFAVDHRLMRAPQVRKAGTMTGPEGDVISKFDLRFVKPNSDSIPTGALHTLEHLLATYFREHLDGVIDLSPMGCRTGFYLSLWRDLDPRPVEEALKKSLTQVTETAEKDVPGMTAEACGNYRDHSLFGAREYARRVLEGLEES